MTDSKHCDYCGRELPPKPTAPHQRFCSGEHRNAWHLERRKEALRQLKQKETKE